MTPLPFTSGFCDPLVLSVVMPAFNEEASIEAVVTEHVKVLVALSPMVADWELIVLDDASSDRTLEILNRLAGRVPKLRVCRHEHNQGIFVSFDDLFRETKGTHIFATASDGQWPVANLRLMMKTLLEHKADLIVGVRLNRWEIYSRWRRLISWAFRNLTRAVLGFDPQDPGSIKLGRREIFQHPLICRSPFVEAERIIQAVAQGYCVEFVPIEFLQRESGKAQGAKVAYLLASLRDCARCFWAYRVVRRQLL